jgi:hypothetical protein
MAIIHKLKPVCFVFIEIISSKVTKIGFSVVNGPFETENEV